ncbi:MAG TPA: nucleoid occlusion factor SlmA [Burkholderiales bacterium]|nr:nucleoid occlusion factor SlmA [Burkholderiales bacterium]
MATKKPGERKLQILQILAEMLQDPKGEKITTAALAARLDVSEAALYRHFASKAQMYEGLIDFIENSLFTVVNQITAEEPNGLKQARAILAMLLTFAEKNPGMTRVLIGDVLIYENPRLQARINQLHDRLEASLKQCLRVAATEEGGNQSEDLAPQANLMLCFVVGRWHQYVKSGFKRKPSEQYEKQWPLLI